MPTTMTGLIKAVRYLRSPLPKIRVLLVMNFIQDKEGILTVFSPLFGMNQTRNNTKVSKR